MLKPWLSRCALIFFSCSMLNVAYAYSEPTKTDPLQIYRDEIKQSENNASQAVLDALKANADASSSPSQQNQSATETPTASAKPTIRSNNDKAFSPSESKSANSRHSSNKNPWLQPNPWLKQPPNIWEKSAKVNPYANAPIPGPTPPKVSANATISPPDIFTPLRPTSNANKPQSNANF